MVAIAVVIGGAIRKNNADTLGCLYNPTESSSDVDWENYAPEVKTRIGSPAASGERAALQQEFGIADANDDLQRDRVGDPNADLMLYIDDKMANAGCYG